MSTTVTINQAISPVKIMAVKGDITAIRTDAMVNSANTAMVLGGSRSVASRINELTGGRLESILANNEAYPKPVPLGQVCVTESDNLPCSFVFHLSTHGDMDEMVAAANEFDEHDVLSERFQKVILNTIMTGVTNLLRECEERRLKRLTIPLIGSGTLNLPKLLVIEVIVGSLTGQVMELSPKYIREINIVTPESSIFSFLNNYLENMEVEVSPNLIDNSVGNEETYSSVPDIIESPDIFKSVEIEGDWESIREEGSENLGSIAFEAIEEINILKKELRKTMIENKKLEDLNQDYREELTNLLDQKRELERNFLLTNRKVKTPEEIWLRTDLPLPLAYAQDILNSEKDPNRRYLLAIAAIGIVHKYFFSLLCAEYKAADCFDPKTNDLVNERFRQNSVTDGSWHWIGMLITRAFKDHNKEGKVVKDFVKLLLKDDGSWSKFSEVLKDLVKLRNQIHETVIPDNARALEWLEQFSDLWNEMCKLSASLLEYELVYIDSIQKFLPGERYRYSVKYLRGGYFAPQSGTLELAEKYNPEELFLRDPLSDRMLALSPFIVFEYSRITNSREAFCLDHLANARFHFRAFRYAQFHYENHEGDGPFFNER